MAGIELCRVGKRWGEDRSAVFTEFSLSVRDGEFLVLLGPSGCGKTTVLRLIAGLEQPTSGTIAIGGRDVTRLPPAERDVAMVFQSYALYPHLTVRENLSFPLRVRRVRRPELVKRVEEVASRLELSGVLDRRPAELSGGQRQRVALGRAIVRAPQVFLLDEPLSNLDARLRVELRAELQRLHAALGATMIYVTHDQVEAMTMGDRIAVLEAGRLGQLGTPAEIYQKPADVFVARFVGSPGMNVLPAVVAVAPTGACATTEVLSVILPPIAYAGPGFLGVRPEHLQIGPPGTGLGDATVVRREPLGAATLVHLNVRGQRLVAHLSGIVEVDVGASVSYRVEPAQCHVFNADGARLT